MQVKRYDNIDIIKAFGIILMVCGHCNAPFTGWLYMFHMAVFFMASGYCWNSHNAKDFTSVKKYIIKKIKTLYIPYVVINSAFVLLSNIFIKINVYTANPECMNVSGSGFVAARNLKDIIYYIIRVIVLWNSEPMGGATWFIAVLFVITIGHCIFEYVIGFIKRQNIKNIIHIIFILFVIVSSEIISKRNFIMPLEHISAPLFSGYVAYLFGIIIKKYENKLKLPIKVPNLLVMVILIIVIKNLYAFGEVSMAAGRYSNFGVLLISSFAGWYLLKSAANIAVNNDKIKKMLLYIGKNTLPIVFFHFLAFKLVSAIYVTMNAYDKEMIAAFPVINDVPDFMWILYALTGVIVPLILNYLYKICFINYRTEKIK